MKEIGTMRNNTKPAECLNNGDYDTKDKDSIDKLYIHFEKYIRKIGCLQIPHQG